MEVSTLKIIWFLYSHSGDIYWAWYLSTWAYWVITLSSRRPGKIPLESPPILDRSNEVIDWPDSCLSTNQEEMQNLDIEQFAFDVQPALPFELTKKARSLLRYYVCRVYHIWAGNMQSLPKNTQLLVEKVIPVGSFTSDLYELLQDEKAVKLCEYITWEILDDCRIAYGIETEYTFEQVLRIIKNNEFAMSLVRWNGKELSFSFPTRRKYIARFRKALKELAPAFIFMNTRLDEIITKYRL